MEDWFTVTEHAPQPTSVKILISDEAVSLSLDMTSNEYIVRAPAEYLLEVLRRSGHQPKAPEPEGAVEPGGRWVPVEERLPPRGPECLVITGSRFSVWLATPTDDGSKWETVTADYRIVELRDVTHWWDGQMPNPMSVVRKNNKNPL